MRIIWLLSCASLVSAAINPLIGLIQQGDAIDLKTVEVSPNIDATVLNNKGYRYNAVRQDVSDINNEYLPPNAETAGEASADVSAEMPQVATVLGDNGYEYKTVRRLKYRQRRDVSEISNEYLPPVEDSAIEVVPEMMSEEELQESAVLGDSGYEYKTVRHLKKRQRRDVSEIAMEYLPPAEDSVTEVVPEIKFEEEPQDSAVLGDSGYEYKTVRRLKKRQRRDVSEVVNEYLPPAEDTATEVVSKIMSEEEPQESAVLGDNGYEYKTVRRLKYRQRRDVSEIANEYLPPAEDTTEVVAEMVSEEEPQESAILGDSGYEYKTVRRLKTRQRRDVSEIAMEYLPPAKYSAIEVVPDTNSEEEPQESSILNDGVVSEISNDYLPPSEETATEVVNEMILEEEPQDSAILGENGYEYKTVRLLKFRHRRDVSEIANEYLPPAEDTATEEVAAIKSVEEPQESAVLGDSGYEYKTVRRLKYRQRRDISEIANEYLPPADETADDVVAEITADEEPQESSLLGDKGYEYKTVRRLKYRQRREVVADIKSEEEPKETTVLGNDGYEYKTVRQLKYRQRSDVSESPYDYLPPSEENAKAKLAEVEPQASAVLGDSGYEYKTVRRLKYRQ